MKSLLFKVVKKKNIHIYKINVNKYNRYFLVSYIPIMNLVYFVNKLKIHNMKNETI